MSVIDIIGYPIALLYWFAFTYMVCYFAGYAKSDTTYYILASIALAIITTLLTLDIYYYMVN